MLFHFMKYFSFFNDPVFSAPSMRTMHTTYAVVLIQVSVIFYFFHNHLQAYIYKTGTCGVTVFDQQACERQVALSSLGQLKIYSAKQTQNEELTA